MSYTNNVGFTVNTAESTGFENEKCRGIFKTRHIVENGYQ